jgi:WhiB family redox-sensing transcriptional regulator
MSAPARPEECMIERRFKHDPDDMAWISRARCNGEDPELFFPVGSAGPATAQIERARSICRRCPVRAECLEWSLATFQDAGVWGGLDEEERREIRRARRRARTTAVSASERALSAVG